MKLLRTLLLAVSLAPACMANAKDYVVTSPDGHLQATVSDTQTLSCSISRDGATVMLPSPIGITTDDGKWGAA